MNKMLKPLLCSPLLFALATPAVAESAASTTDPDQWTIDAAVYLWGASIGGDSATDSEIDISFSDLLKNLNFAGMGAIAATKGKWTLGSDIIYLNVDDENDGGFTLPVGPDLAVSTDSDISLKAWVITPTVQYKLVDNGKATLSALGGARFLWIKVGVKYDTASALGNTQRIDESDSGSVWDGIVGVKGRFKLSDKWYLPYYADAGTGQSQYTWQVFGGVAYRFSKVDAVLGYRYTAWDFDEGMPLDNLNLHGPMAGVSFRF